MVDRDSFCCYFGCFAVIYDIFVESIAFTWLFNVPDLRFYVVFAKNNDPIGVWLFDNTSELRSLYIIITCLVRKCIYTLQHMFCMMCTTVRMWSVKCSSADLTFLIVKFHISITRMYIHSWWLLHSSPYDYQNCSCFNQTVHSITQDKLTLTCSMTSLLCALQNWCLVTVSSLAYFSVVVYPGRWYHQVQLAYWYGYLVSLALIHLCHRISDVYHTQVT